MDWQILTTFFSFLSLLVGVVILMAQTHVKKAQTAQANALIELHTIANQLLSIVREMDRQQDLFVRQMPPHQEQVHPMDTEELPEGYKWLTNQSQEDVNERFKDAARKAVQEFNDRMAKDEPEITHFEVQVPKKRGNTGAKRGKYKKRSTKID